MSVEARLRFRFERLGRIRFTSQRDVARMWERALRRSRLPVAWSEGFAPRPLISFGLALPTGCESRAEFVDVSLERPPGIVAQGASTGNGGFGDGPDHPPSASAAAELPPLLTSLLPEGISVTASAPVPIGSGSLQQDVTSCTWDIEVDGPTGTELPARVQQFLAAPKVMVERERKGRLVCDDLRPAVLYLGCVGTSSGTAATTFELQAELATQPRGVRPPELVGALGADLTLVRACRSQQWIERDGIRVEPLSAGGVIAEPRVPGHPDHAR